jgi:hypothetical protein
MAAMNKYLAQNNKSRIAAKATKQTAISSLMTFSCQNCSKKAEWRRVLYLSVRL